MSRIFPLERVRTVSEAIVRHRRALHAIPEVGLDLPLTSAYVAGELRNLGLEPTFVGSSLWADVGDRGPLVALRADMDALPVEEQTGLPWASRHAGAMHACGHDAHSAALLGVAALLAEAHGRGELAFRVRLIFQAGEEGRYGALPLIEAGVLEGVRAITGGHVGLLADGLAPGAVGFLSGPVMAASDRFEGAFLGSGGHGSAPHQSPDPIAAFAAFASALNAFRARELDQSRPAVVSLCAVHAGSSHTVIPERADFKGTARSLHADVRSHLQSRIGEIGAAIAALHGLTFDFRWLGGYPPVVNAAAETGLAQQAAAAVLGADRVTILDRPLMAGEDFAYYLERVPGCFWFLNTSAPARGLAFPNHNPRFDVDEALLADFAAVLLAAAEGLATAEGSD